MLLASGATIPAETRAALSGRTAVTVTAPAFLAPGDQAQVGLRLTRTSGPAGEMRLAVQQTGGDAPLTTSLAAESVELTDASNEAATQMAVTAGQTEGRAELRLTLTTPDGAALTKDITIPVALNEADIQRQDRLELAPGESLSVPPQLLRQSRTDQ